MSMLFALFLAGAVSGVKAKLDLVVAQDGPVVLISVFNRGDYAVMIPESLSLTSIDGNLDLEISRSGRKFPRQAEGNPAPKSTALVRVAPAHLYGTAIPKRYISNIYRLAPGCYSVIATFAQSKAGVPPVHSKPTEVCF